MTEAKSGLFEREAFRYASAFLMAIVVGEYWKNKHLFPELGPIRNRLIAAHHFAMMRLCRETPRCIAI